MAVSDSLGIMGAEWAENGRRRREREQMAEELRCKADFHLTFKDQGLAKLETMGRVLGLSSEDVLRVAVQELWNRFQDTNPSVTSFVPDPPVDFRPR